MSEYEHRNGFTCEDMEDRLDDVRRELDDAYLSLTRIHKWLGGALNLPLESDETLGAVEDAYHEAREKVEIR